MPRFPVDRVCVVMMSALGDAVHVLPLINAIKRVRPGSRVTWILQPVPATLVRGHPAVDDIITFDRAGGAGEFLRLRRKLAGRRFDLALALQVYFKAGIVTALTPARVKLGFDFRRARDANWLFTTDRIPPRPVQHVQDQYLEFLDHLGIPREPLEWNLGPWESERIWQRELEARHPRPIASFVIGTSKPEKDWMAERWARLADTVYSDFGLQPILVGGDSAREREAAATIIATARAPVVSEMGSGVRRLVSILDASAVTISPDTGPLHISVALGTPVISLMGYSNPKRTGPYRRFTDLIVDAYGDPGENYVPSLENRPGRMKLIEVADVVSKLELWRERY